MGQLLATMGRCEEAESVLRACGSLDGSHSKDPVNHETSRVSALVTLGKLHADRGKYLDAVQAYKRAVSILPPYYNSRVSRPWQFFVFVVSDLVHALYTTNLPEGTRVNTFGIVRCSVYSIQVKNTVMHTGVADENWSSPTVFLNLN